MLGLFFFIIEMRSLTSLLDSLNLSGEQEQEVARAVRHPECRYIQQLCQHAEEAVHPVSVCL